MPRYGGKNVYVDDSVFQRQARKLARKLKVDEHEFVKTQTGILAREVAKMTPPYISFPSLYKGTSVGSKQDLEQGERAVFYDIVRIAKPVSRQAAGWAKGRFNDGPIFNKKKGKIAPGVIWNKSDLYQWHKRNEQMNGRTKKLAKYERPWVPEDVWHDYVKERQSNVGIAKAAFVKASQALGAKGGVTPKIKRHLMRTSGKGNMQKTKGGPLGVVEGRADGLWHTTKHLPALQRNRLIKAMKRLQYMSKQAAKASGFKVR